MKHYIRTCSYLDQDEVVVWIRVRRQRYSVQPVTTCRSAALASLATSSYSLYFNIDSFVFVPAQFILHNSVYPGHVFTKLFRIRIKIRPLLCTFFETYYDYLTDCWYLIIYILQTRLLGILSFFVIEKVNFIVATAMQI